MYELFIDLGKDNNLCLSFKEIDNLANYIKITQEHINEKEKTTYVVTYKEPQGDF